jgi:hypothetical protein
MNMDPLNASLKEEKIDMKAEPLRFVCCRPGRGMVSRAFQTAPGYRDAPPWTMVGENISTLSENHVWVPIFQVKLKS